MRASAARACASVTSSSVATIGAQRLVARLPRARKCWASLDRRDLCAAQLGGSCATFRSCTLAVWCKRSAAAHSITLGTRNRPRSTAGALRWLASRWFGSLTTSSRRRSATSWTGGHRVRQRLDARGVDRAHLLHDVEETVDLCQHALAFVGVEVQAAPGWRCGAMSGGSGPWGKRCRNQM